MHYFVFSRDYLVFLSSNGFQEMQLVDIIQHFTFGVINYDNLKLVSHML